MKNRNINMTSGPLMRNMIAYAIPVILSGILQLLYSAADLIIVGQFAGSEAFAAIGAAGSLNHMFIIFFIAVSGGGCICVAQYYGARDARNVHETVHTCTAISIFGGIFVALIALFFVDDILKSMGTHEDIIDMSATYLKILMGAAPFNFFYNFAAGILRAAGDTKRPLYILLMTGLVNVALNLVLVIGFGMDVEGVAIATITATVLNALIAGYILVKSDDCIKLNFRKIKIYPDKLKKIVNYGLPSGLENLASSIGGVYVQVAVNSFGSVAVVAGHSAAGNIEGFITTAMVGTYNAALIFTGQNYGAKQYKRVKKVLLNGIIMATVVGLSMGMLARIFGTQLLSLYEPNDPQAVQYGMIRLAFLSGLYFICGVGDILIAGLRGIGSSWTPMIFIILGVSARFLWILFAFPHIKTLTGLYVAWPLAWAVYSIPLAVAIAILWKRKFAKDSKQSESAVETAQ